MDPVAAIEEFEAIRQRFVPNRLRMARELRGKSQTDLAGTGAEQIVTPAAISQYENGTAVPSAPVLGRLVERLSVDPEFFTQTDVGLDTPAFFRSLRSAPANERKRARHNVQVVHAVVRELSRYVDFPSVDVPSYPVAEDDDDSRAVEAARHVREVWAIPPGPIPDVVRLLERHGVVVAWQADGHDKIDAFSVDFADRPVVVMSAAKSKRDRSRFDVSHELGHLVMHDAGMCATKVAERQAQVFAAELLMPEHEIRPALPQTFDLDTFVSLKRQWRVSIAALLYRSKSLGRMGDEAYLRAVKLMSARGWRKHEPADLGVPEEPGLLRTAMELARLTPADLAAATHIPLDILEPVVGLAEGGHRPKVLL